MGKNTCRCPSPPGGIVECPDGYMPFCIIKENEIPRSLCLAPTHDESNVQILNEVLSFITNNPRPLFSPFTNSELTILQKGFYRTENTTITFTLTEKLKSAVEEIINERRRFDRGFNNSLESEE